MSNPIKAAVVIFFIEHHLSRKIVAVHATRGWRGRGENLLAGGVGGRIRQDFVFHPCPAYR
jgi:hypothetical protein